jgi:hypothetical protein
MRIEAAIARMAWRFNAVMSYDALSTTPAAW